MTCLLSLQRLPFFTPRGAETSWPHDRCMWRSPGLQMGLCWLTLIAMLRRWTCLILKGSHWEMERVPHCLSWHPGRAWRWGRGTEKGKCLADTQILGHLVQVPTLLGTVTDPHWSWHWQEGEIMGRTHKCLLEPTGFWGRLRARSWSPVGSKGPLCISSLPLSSCLRLTFLIQQSDHLCFLVYKA